jgi:SAM-dependent methyltransferase
LISAGVSGFKAQEASGYDAVAESFDRLTERFSGALAERLLSLADPKAGDRVLDIGTGTGLVALRAARRVSPRGAVLGIDISRGMLERARQKAVEQGVAESVRFEEMDAEALAAADASFDVVVSLFALPHLPDPIKAVSEMSRVLRPGGRIAVGVGSRAPLGFRGAVRKAIALFEERRGRRLVAPSFLIALMERHLPAVSSQEAPGHLRPGEVAALLEGAGFVGLRRSWDGQEAVIRSAEEFWEVQHTFSSAARRRLTQLAPEELAPLRRAFFERCEAVLSSGGRLVYPYGAAFFVGSRA